MSLRCKLPEGGDITPAAAARRLAMDLPAFKAALPDLVNRGFPPPDPTTGNFCLEAIDAWRLARYPQFFRLNAPAGARDAKDVVAARLGGIRASG